MRWKKAIIFFGVIGLTILGCMLIGEIALFFLILWVFEFRKD